MKHIQLAKLYKHGQFFGYGLAVDGELLKQQIDTTITTEPDKLPTINASFYLKEQQAENPIIIHLDQVEISPL
ncbi:hypothetical protein LLS47_21280 [Rouxiella badensis]|uniref:Uncharacterized protein n=1 Tax=Rouxiella silvae TaxID=1646373 RepID=A0AA40X487_9GAMM|nr:MULTISPECIES: hypothetical protein [Rouxiella]MBF6637892.1 hypothetical protein [Rouxiella silvae]MCC3735466.1 hypothetical protein [Rouxiella badensis]MCC3760763.1 hypothetical protein [Rouxiella badensis]